MPAGAKIDFVVGGIPAILTLGRSEPRRACDLYVLLGTANANGEIFADRLRGDATDR